MTHQNGQTRALSLAERKLVQDEIKREYARFKQKAKREPTKAERKQIVAIGFAMARKQNSRIPAAPGVAANSRQTAGVDRQLTALAQRVNGNAYIMLLNGQYV